MNVKSVLYLIWVYVCKMLKYLHITSDFTVFIVHFCDTGP